MAYTIGLDYGTNSVRCVIVDVTNGGEVATSVYEYPTGEAGIIIDPADHNLARQNPADYIKGIEATVKKALAQAKKTNKAFNASQVVGIGIDTTGSTPLPVTQTGKPLAMLDEFKKFVMRGNVLDLAVAVIIGAAFGAIVVSFVNDILMPPIGLLLGGVDFSNLFISLDGQSYPSLAAAQEAGAPTINYGVFINTVINFLIIAFAIFLIVRLASRMQKEEAPGEPTTKECPHCISTIPINATRCPNCTSQLA